MVFYWFAIFAVIIQFASLSLESGVAFLSARENQTDRQLLGLSLLWSIVAGTIAVALIGPVARLFHQELQYPFYFPLCFIAGNMLIAFGNSFCYSKYEFIGPGAVATMVNLLLILLLFYPAPASSGAFPQSRAAAETFIGFYFASFLVHGAVLFGFVFLRFRIFPTFRFRPAKMKLVFSYSLKAFVGNVLFLLVSRVDYFFVKKYCTAADLGNYIQVSKIGQLFLMLPSMVATVLFPIIAGGMKPAIADRVRSIAVMILLVYGVVLGMLALLGKWLFPWVYGNSFGEMYLPFVLLIPGILAMSASYPYTAYYSAVNRIHVNIEGHSLALLFIVAADWIFIPLYGIAAAALISSIGYTLFYMYVLFVFKKEFRFPFRKLFTLNRNEYFLIMQRFKR